MRCRIVIDCVLNMDNYTDHEYLMREARDLYGENLQHIGEYYCIYSGLSNVKGDLSSLSEIQSVFKRDILRIRNEREHCDLWQFHSAANVLNSKLVVLFPTKNIRDNTRADHNRVFLPKSRNFYREFGLMWTALSDDPKKYNHLVPLVNSKTVSVGIEVPLQVDRGKVKKSNTKNVKTAGKGAAPKKRKCALERLEDHLGVENEGSPKKGKRQKKDNDSVSVEEDIASPPGENKGGSRKGKRRKKGNDSDSVEEDIPSPQGEDEGGSRKGKRPKKGNDSDSVEEDIVSPQGENAIVTKVGRPKQTSTSDISEESNTSRLRRSSKGKEQVSANGTNSVTKGRGRKKGKEKGKQNDEDVKIDEECADEANPVNGEEKEGKGNENAESVEDINDKVPRPGSDILSGGQDLKHNESEVLEEGKGNQSAESEKDIDHKAAQGGSVVSDGQDLKNNESEVLEEGKGNQSAESEKDIDHKAAQGGSVVSDGQDLKNNESEVLEEGKGNQSAESEKDIDHKAAQGGSVVSDGQHLKDNESEASGKGDQKSESEKDINVKATPGGGVLSDGQHVKDYDLELTTDKECAYEDNKPLKKRRREGKGKASAESEDINDKVSLSGGHTINGVHDVKDKESEAGEDEGSSHEANSVRNVKRKQKDEELRPDEECTDNNTSSNNSMAKELLLLIKESSLKDGDKLLNVEQEDKGQKNSESEDIDVNVTRGGSETIMGKRDVEVNESEAREGQVDELSAVYVKPRNNQSNLEEGQVNQHSSVNVKDVDNSLLKRFETKPSGSISKDNEHNSGSVSKSDTSEELSSSDEEKKQRESKLLEFPVEGDELNDECLVEMVEKIENEDGGSKKQTELQPDASGTNGKGKDKREDASRFGEFVEDSSDGGDDNMACTVDNLITSIESQEPEVVDALSPEIPVEKTSSKTTEKDMSLCKSQNNVGNSDGKFVTSEHGQTLLVDSIADTSNSKTEGSAKRNGNADEDSSDKCSGKLESKKVKPLEVAGAEAIAEQVQSSNEWPESDSDSQQMEEFFRRHRIEKKCKEFPLRAFLPETWEEYNEKQSWPGLQIRDVVEGRGVFAIQEFEKHQAICNYGGVLLNEDYVKKTLLPYEDKCNYLVEMREKKFNKWVTLYLNHDDSTYSMGKYINHSKLHPNLTYKIYVTKDRKLDLIFFAKSKIVKGSQLLWNYGNQFSGVEDCVQSCQKCKNKIM